MFARVALDLPVPQEFTYEVPERLVGRLEPGQRVRVPFGPSSRVGYLVALEERTSIEKTRAIAELVDREPLVPGDLMLLARWIAGYYCCSLGEALQTMLPGGVRRAKPRHVRVVVRTGEGELPARAAKAKVLLEALVRCERPPAIGRLLEDAGASRAALKTLERAGLVRIEEHDLDEELEAHGPAGDEVPPTPEPDQERVLASVGPDLVAPRFRVHLLLGVTGSGKTEVYLRAIAETRERGRQAIVLVPEIALTPQTVRRFRARFSRVEVLHSGQTDKRRRQAWQRIRRDEVDVVIGPRSAVFAPVARLGLIVVDEEHESSFKQDKAPRYHARDVAVMRARDAGCPVILGSATPSLESYANGLGERYVLHRLPRRAGGFALPPVEMVDMAAERGRIFSRRMRLAVADAVAAGGQVILFLNRRGFATVVQCARCDHALGCPDCSTTLVFHKGRRQTACHHCGHNAGVPTKCPDCSMPALKFIGFGTERVEEEAAEAWPGIPLLRVDSDSVRGGRLEAALDSFRHGEARILVGTQMVAKGHHFPDVTLVGIVNADTALHLADFRANERTFGLIAQVAGRAGRGEKGGHVLVQTFHPHHYAIRAAARHDFESFAKEELEEREAFGLPPTRRCALLVISGEDDDATRDAAHQLAEVLREPARLNGVELRGPARAPMERLRGRWRRTLLLLSKHATGLARTCACARAAKVPRRFDVTIDVDPAAVL